jgi:hypothetical protein
MVRKAALAVVPDVLSIIAFVVAGRRNHQSSDGIADVLGVAAPFLIALIAGWCIQQLWRNPVEVRAGIILWLITVTFGMVLRRSMFDRGIAVSFIVVAALVLGILLVGWRALASRWVLPRFAARAQ